MTQALQRRKDRKGPKVLSSISVLIALTAHKLPRGAAKPNKEANATESMMANEVIASGLMTGATNGDSVENADEGRKQVDGTN
jgi:hypothetical protein